MNQTSLCLAGGCTRHKTFRLKWVLGTNPLKSIGTRHKTFVRKLVLGTQSLAPISPISAELSCVAGIGLGASMPAKQKSSGGGEGGGKSQKTLPLPTIPADSKDLPHIHQFEEWVNFGTIFFAQCPKFERRTGGPTNLCVLP